MNSFFKPEEIRIDIVPLLGTFVDDRFSHAVRVTHLPTQTVTYRSPFDFPEPKLRDELIERALSELQKKVQRLQLPKWEEVQVLTEASMGSV